MNAGSLYMKYGLPIPLNILINFGICRFVFAVKLYDEV
jgi:hypothetical protein